MPLPETWYPLAIYFHLQNLEEEVRKRITEQSRRVGQLPDTTVKQIWMLRGSWITFVPRINGAEFNPKFHEIAWYEDIQEVPFRFRLGREQAGLIVGGTIDVCTEGNLLVAQLPISLMVRDPFQPVPTAERDPDKWVSGSARMFETIFASYAHKDHDVVENCAAAYKALGIHMYIDSESLRAGEAWHPALLQLIDRSDVFQLYWSAAAKQSHPVENEWRHALTQRGIKGETFVRGLYWTKPMPEPPAELSARETLNKSGLRARIG